MYHGVLFDSVLQQCMAVGQLLSYSVSDKETYRAVWRQLKKTLLRFTIFVCFCQHITIIREEVTDSFSYVYFRIYVARLIQDHSNRRTTCLCSHDFSNTEIMV